MKGTLRPLFQDITPEIVQSIQTNPVCLESTCLLNRNNNREVQIVLTNTHIALADPTLQPKGYQYYCALNYELKFELIYEQELTAPPSDSTIYSRVVGFTLQKTGSQPMEIIILGESVV